MPAGERCRRAVCGRTARTVRCGGGRQPRTSRPSRAVPGRLPPTLQRAHASTRVLAAFQLTIDPKRNCAALGRGFWFVAAAAVSTTLPLFARSSRRARVAAPGGGCRAKWWSVRSVASWIRCSSPGLVTAESPFVGCEVFRVLVAAARRGSDRAVVKKVEGSVFPRQQTVGVERRDVHVVVFASAIEVDQPTGAGSSRSRPNAAASSPAHGQFAGRRRTARRAWNESLPAVCSSR